MIYDDINTFILNRRDEIILTVFRRFLQAHFGVLLRANIFTIAEMVLLIFNMKGLGFCGSNPLTGG